MHGLGEQLKEQLIRQVLDRRARRAADAQHGAGPAAGSAGVPAASRCPRRYGASTSIPATSSCASSATAPRAWASPIRIFRVHDGIAGSLTRIAGREYLNFSSYNYLGLSGDPRVNAAGRARDRPLRHLGLREPPGVGRAAAAPRAGARARRGLRRRRLRSRSSAATPPTSPSSATCSGRRDLVLHDALIHNSVLQGIAALRARTALPSRTTTGRRSTRMLARERRAVRARADRGRGHLQHGRRLSRPAALRRGQAPAPRLPDGGRGAFLRRDGRDAASASASTSAWTARDVDIWMGTLSKSLASCGGFIAGGARAGRAPASSSRRASSTASAWRRRSPRRRSRRSSACWPSPSASPRCRRAGRAVPATQARDAGIDTGTSQGNAIVPAITGSSVARRRACRRRCSSAASTCSRSCTRRCPRTARGCASSSARSTPRSRCAARSARSPRKSTDS